MSTDVMWLISAFEQVSGDPSMHTLRVMMGVAVGVVVEEEMNSWRREEAKRGVWREWEGAEEGEVWRLRRQW